LARFGERLRALREEKGLSQAEFGRSFRLGKSTISNYETETTSPTPYQLQAFADFFGVSVDYLLGRTNVRSAGLQVNEPSTAYGIDEDEDVQVFLRHYGDLTKEQRQRLREYIEFLKFEHRRKGIGEKPSGKEDRE